MQGDEQNKQQLSKERRAFMNNIHNETAHEPDTQRYVISLVMFLPIIYIPHQSVCMFDTLDTSTITVLTWRDATVTRQDDQ